MIPFIFSNDWVFYSHDGTRVNISKNDLKSYADNDITEDQVKSFLYSYMTGISITDFNSPLFQTYEF
jgi:hypothetical protein